MSYHQVLLFISLLLTENHSSKYLQLLLQAQEMQIQPLKWGLSPSDHSWWQDHTKSAGKEGMKDADNLVSQPNTTRADSLHSSSYLCVDSAVDRSHITVLKPFEIEVRKST